MRERALFAIFPAMLLAGCGEAEHAIGGWDQLDSRYRAECAPSGEEGVLHAWKGGKRYCFRYTIERIKPERNGPAVVVAQADQLAVY
jgi:hypothetical protein